MTDPGLPEDDGATGDAIARRAEAGDPLAMRVWTELRAAREIANAIDRVAEALHRLADAQM